jgi:hypothetical protein
MTEQEGKNLDMFTTSSSELSGRGFMVRQTPAPDQATESISCCRMLGPGTSPEEKNIKGEGRKHKVSYNFLCIRASYWPPLWSSGHSSWLQNGDVLCFLWGTNWIYICYVEESRPSLWSSGQSSWLQIQKSCVRFPALPDFLSSTGFGARWHFIWGTLSDERMGL